MLYENGVTTGKPLTYQAKVLAVDEFHDIALLKVDRKFRYPVMLEDDKNISPGNEVYSYGYPFDYGLMLTRGNLMRKNYSESGPQRADDGSYIHIVDMTLTDFMAGPGTSGAGVFLVRTGKLIGMMRLLSPKGYNAVSLMVAKALTPVPVIELMLKANRVPYLLPDGSTATYPPLPPAPANPPAPGAAPGAKPGTAPAAQPPAVTPSNPAKDKERKHRNRYRPKRAF
jgi:hypothetical protein